MSKIDLSLSPIDVMRMHGLGVSDAASGAVTDIFADLRQHADRSLQLGHLCTTLEMQVREAKRAVADAERQLAFAEAENASIADWMCIGWTAFGAACVVIIVLLITVSTVVTR